MIHPHHQAATSRRGGIRNPDPLRHALSRGRARAGLGRRTTYDATCGAQVAWIVDPDGFDDRHPRACRRCVKVLNPRKEP